jgi:hypothetical protein
MLQSYFDTIRVARDQGGPGRSEVEVRFHDVTRAQFIRLKSFLTRPTKGITITTERTTDYIQGDIRRTVSGETVTWLRKNRVWWVDVPEYSLRIAVNRELDIAPLTEFKSTVIRNKDRMSVMLTGGTVRVDLTEVSMQVDGQDRVVYEVEIELLQFNLPALESAVSFIYRQLLETTELYTWSERKAVLGQINNLLNPEAGPETGRLDPAVVVQARNLKLRDLVWGGIIANPITGYTVTHKADGVRKLLVFHKSGVWLVMGTEVNCVRHGEVPQLTGTILDGELIPSESKLPGAPQTRHWYVAFDCLAIQGQTNIQMQPHADRMKISQIIADKFKDTLLYVTTKAFHSFNTPERFFEVMASMFREQPFLVYRNDGFMFTPETTPYNSHSDQNPLPARVLTRYPDICKWKPLEKLTIDFRIIWRAGMQPRELELNVFERGQDVKFTGSKLNPFDMTMVDVDNPMTRNLPTGTIVEYGWDIKTERLLPQRLRLDKLRPNHKNIAVDVWDDIHHPIDIETLSGQSLALVRAYQNQVKRALYDSDTGETLLDIGGGRGGDVSKWRRYRRVVTVEPNADNRQELEHRIQVQGIQGKVRVVAAGGEETEVITKVVRDFLGQANTVSLMLSLSFFFGDPTKLRSLAQTIITNLKPGGQILYLTIDGDSVDQVFDPAFQGVVLKRLDLGPANFERVSPNEMKVHIAGTIVEDQTEWLVRLPELVDALNAIAPRFTLTSRHRATTEKFMSAGEALYSEMYSFGSITSGLVATPELAPPPVMPQLGLKPQLPSPKLVQDPLVSTVPGALPVPRPLSPRPPLPAQPLKSVTPVIQPGPIPQPAPVIQPAPIVQPQPAPVVQPTQTPRTELPWLQVTPPLRFGAVIPNTPAYGDDAVEQLVVPWYQQEKVYRIATIGDGSCFFHAFLKAWYSPYQTDSNYDFRYNLVKRLRRDLAWLLGQPNPESKATYWATAANGGFVERNRMQQAGTNFGVPFQYSLEGLQKLINSMDYVGEEVYNYTADVIGFDVYVMYANRENLQLIHIAEKVGTKRPAVVIQGNGRHYEVVAIERQGQLQTNFTSEDALIRAIRTLRH